MDEPGGEAVTVIILIAALVTMQAFFAAAEIAFVRLGRVGAKEVEERGARGAKILASLWRRPEAALATILIGITSLNIFASSLAEKLAHEQLGSAGGFLAFFLTSAFIIVWGEIIPMYYAATRPRRVALITSPIVFLLQRLLFPLVAALGVLSRTLAGKASEGPTREEIEAAVGEARKAGLLSEERGRMILASLTFREKTLKEVMVPRVDLIMLPEAATVEEAAKLAEETGKSRFPVYAGARDEVTGIVHVKDIIASMAKGEGHKKVGEIKREVLFLPETMPLHLALREMQRARTRMALVVDEYGGVEGAVTLKDLLEELVGEIRDEHERQRVEESVRPAGEGAWVAAGRATLREVSKVTGVELDINEVKTVAGLIMEKLGRLPKPGDEVRESGLVFTVERLKGKRIEKVRVRREEGE